MLLVCRFKVANGPNLFILQRSKSQSYCKEAKVRGYKDMEFIKINSLPKYYQLVHNKSRHILGKGHIYLQFGTDGQAKVELLDNLQPSS